MLAALVGCKKPAANRALREQQFQQPPPRSALSDAESTRPAMDACALLTSQEIESVLGEPVKLTTPTAKSSGRFETSQCYFTLPNVANSAVLTLVQKGNGSGARDPKEFWRETFAGDREIGRDREEKETKSKPQKIDGLGEEAFWSGSPVGGALYVLKRNSYIRISVGGGGDQASKIQKCRSLAESVLKHF